MRGVVEPERFRDTLQELGVPPVLLEKSTIVFQDDQGRHHDPVSFCDGPARRRTRDVRNVRPCDIIDQRCMCLDVPQVSDMTWDVLRDLQRGVALLMNVPTDLHGRYQYHCDLQELLEFLEVAFPPKASRDAVTEACLEARGKLRSRTEAEAVRAASWFRSETARRSHHERLGTIPSGTLLALGFRHCNPWDAVYSVAGTLALTYGVPHPVSGPQVLLLDEALVQAVLLDPALLLPTSEWVSLHTLNALDTPEVVEVVRTLWEPGTSKPLSNLNAAFDAARALLQ